MNTTTKNLIIAGAVIVAGYLAYQWYQKKQAQTNATPTGTVNQIAAPKSETSQLVDAGVAAVSKISEFFS